MWPASFNSGILDSNFNWAGGITSIVQTLAGAGGGKNCRQNDLLIGGKSLGRRGQIFIKSGDKLPNHSEHKWR